MRKHFVRHTTTQLHNFNASSYTGNARLCGLPLPSKCNAGDEVLSRVPTPPCGNENDQDDKYEKWCRIGAAVGLSTVFRIIFGVFGIKYSFWDNLSYTSFKREVKNQT